MLQRLVLSVALIAASARTADADGALPGKADQSREHFDKTLDWKYFWDGGALPFLYGSLGVAVGLRLFAEPPDSPRLFSASEGGEASLSDTVPSYAVGLYAGAGAAVVAFVPSSASLYHLKGYGEAVFTTLAMTEMAKDFFGRHRPHYQEGDTELDSRRSFFSGHSSLNAATTVYLGLYFHEHIAPRLLGPRADLYKALTYTLLGGAFVGVPLSRVIDHRHHPSDVITGAVVGSSLATVFYAYQESRYQDDREEFYGAKRSRLVLVPDIQNRGLVVMTRW